ALGDHLHRRRRAWRREPDADASAEGGRRGLVSRQAWREESGKQIMGRRRGPMTRALIVLLFLLPFAVQAEITRIEITSETPFAGGKSFGAVGPYVKVTGRFHGDLDPSYPGNKVIADIKSAPRNARGRVDYSADFEVLRPADPAKGNGTLFYDVNNRGNKRLIHLLNDTPANNALDTPETAGDGFLMRHGFSIAWSGWIPAGRSFPAAPNLLRLEVPNAEGIEQPV